MPCRIGCSVPLWPTFWAWIFPRCTTMLCIATWTDCTRTASNPQAKRGYSRDKRPDCKQVLVGLVLDRDGFPKAHEVFDGNRQDRTTVGEMLDSLQKRTGRQPERNAWLGEFEQSDDWEEVIRVPSPRNPDQEKSQVRIKRRQQGEEVYLLCLSEGREEKDRAIRESHEQRLKKDLGKLQARI